MTAEAIFGQCGAEHGVWAQLRDCVGQLRRASGRAAWLAELRCVPKALRWALPWAVLGRTSRDANPCRWLERQARRRRDVVAVSDPSRTLTFEELRCASLEVAAALERRGATERTRVAILLPTGIDQVVTLFGCWQLGAVPCPLDPGAATSVLDDVRAQFEPGLELADYAALLATSSAPGTTRGSKQLSPKQRFWASRAAHGHAPLHASAVAMILPTSGSEGHLKLCRITAGRLALSGHAFGGVALGCQRGDVIYCPLPLCHATGITVGLMPALVHGVTLHLPGKFSAARLLQDLHATRATQLVYVGDLLRMAVAALASDADTSPRASASPRDGEDGSTLDVETPPRGGSSPLDVRDRSTLDSQPRIAFECSTGPSTSRAFGDGSGASLSHRLRVAVGNGLDQRMYRRAASALHIPRIVEFYGATEAPRVLLNLSNRPGSCGRVAFRRLSRFVVVKERVPGASDESRVANEADPSVDAAPSELGTREPGERERATNPNAGAKRTDKVHREPRGEVGTHGSGTEPSVGAAGAGCAWTPCKPGEVGELWIRIPSRKRPWLGDFEGYLDREQEARVVLHDVFRPGDRFYRTYDLVRYDADDYFYFVERLGKVWRNRGHNVSTTWLTDELRLVSGLKDVSVFPVALDESPRRFGLALVVTDDHERLRDALTHKIRSLPNYARPQLIQAVPSIPRTLSFKPTSASQTKCGPWEPSDEASALYLWDNGLRAIALAEWAATKRRLLAR